MKTASSYPLEEWAERFREFRQVNDVRIDHSAERLDVTVKGRKDVLQFPREDLDDILYKFDGNPHEVVAYYLKKNGIIVYYQDTLVGFFDIIGYSSFIEKTSIEEAILKISGVLNGIRDFARADIWAVKLDRWIFSDTVIIVVDTTRHPLFCGSLEVFLATCSAIMADSMKAGFPLRGAIGGGDFYKDGEVMVSSALVDAARYEKKQEWLGAVLTPKAVEVIEKAKDLQNKLRPENPIDFDSEKFNHYIRYGKIPWKEEVIKTYYIKPYDFGDEDWAEKYLPKYFDGKEKIKNSHDLYAQK